jgi:TATA-binding protein-associated factor Taf7
MTRKNAVAELEDEDTTAPGETRRSELAQEIKDFQSSIADAMKKRERLPQPLFWSLFNSRIKDIRKRRELLRTLDELFGS